jgi:iron complex transport system ATP-binding protein
MMELVIENLTKDYGDTRALDSVSVTLGPGHILALVGPNGSGKSTLIKIVATIFPKSSGSVMLDGTDVFEIEPAELARCVGYVPQFFSYTKYSTVFEMVLLGRRPHIRWSVTEEELARVQDALDALDIGHLAGKYVDELSGGERQKVFIARAIAQDPGLFLLDEPTASLDIRHQIEVMELMQKVARIKGSAVLVAVHDLNLAFRFADSVLMICEGRMAGYGSPAEVLTPEQIEKVYGIESEVVTTGRGSFILPLRAKRGVAGETSGR